MLGKGKKKIRVLHIITRLIIGGAQWNTLLTVINLDKTRYQTTLVSGPALGSEGELLSEAHQSGVDLTIIPELVREISPIADLMALRKLCRFIGKGRYDIVHTHSSKAGILGRLAAKISGVKNIVHTPHGSIFSPGAKISGVSGRFKLKFFLLLEMVATRITHKIITLTNSEAREYMELGIANKDKLITIHSGIRLSEFSHAKVDIASMKKELGIPPDSMVVTTVARLMSEKGHKYLIEAAKEAVTEFEGNIRFVFAGDGDLKPLLEKTAAELDLSGDVMFLGLRNDISEILAISDLFVLPSLYEAQGRVVVEAMAAGLPVIATSVGGLPDVVVNGETGFLVPPAEPKALASAIISMLTDRKKSKEMGQAGRKRVDPEFSVEVMVERIDMLYRGLMVR